ncbi:MAG: hypothetical protein ACW99Q_14735 [Candidatus Kariarchaeaceae archaeon]|jgi:hypothetical protein
MLGLYRLSINFLKGWNSNISEKQEQNVKIEFNRWMITIPLLIIAIGVFPLIFVKPLDPTIGLIGMMIMLVGIVSFGALSAYMVGLEFAARALKESRPQKPFREQYDDYERKVEEREVEEKHHNE